MSAAPRRRRALKQLASVVALVVIATVASPADGAPLAGSAGTNTSLPDTDSAVSVSGRGPFAALRVSVNQTKNLLNQAISVDWSGVTPTRVGPGRFAANFLQIMQCWGDDDGTNAENPGPAPERCVAGARAATYGGVNDGNFPPFAFSTERIISQKGWANYDPSVGHLDPRTNYVWRPFESVDGTVVDTHFDPTFQPDVQGGLYWLNPYFNIVTTNEIAGGRTGANGQGSELFEVTTGFESSGLGCGQQVEPTDGGAKRIPKCWLVVVPRGEPVDENAGTPFGGSNADSFGVLTSPLAPAQWEHRIAIPLEFNPVDTACKLDGDQRQIVGSELAARAVESWQPKLCENPALLPYAYGPLNDASARQQIVLAPPGAPGLAVVSRPIADTELDPASPAVYAPLTVSGTVIAFNVERNPKLTAPDDAQALAGVRIADLNLTPRLLAKLLTQSYGSQVDILGDAPYEWSDANPSHLALDPDFVQFNPEFEQLSISQARNFGGFLMPAANSDAARQLWDYVLADPEAKAWLDGGSDGFGMKVNPVYATSASANPSGIPFADPVPSSFPKSDPYCFQGQPTGNDGTVVPPPLCGTDWVPYMNSFRDAARLARAADDGAKVTENPFATSSDQVYRRDIPQVLGTRAMLSITDSAAAFQYGLQTARLSRAGDNGPDRTFVAADPAGLTAGVDGMRPKSNPAVLEPAPVSANPQAYPLTLVTYGVIRPLTLDATAREHYAAFVDYAAGDGQVQGQRQGQLPPGYAPLPAALRTQASQAAGTIRTLTAAAAIPVAAAVSEDVALQFPAAQTAVVSPSVSTPIDAAPVPELAPVPETSTPVASTKPVRTPAVSAPFTRLVLPWLGLVALAGGLASLELASRSRRRRPAT